ncbi:MAG: DUF1499 domain-containing protein [Pseudomonadota bacterium]
MSRLLLPLIAILTTLCVFGWLWVNFMPLDPERWSIDPAGAERKPSPNSFLVAPEGATSAKPDIPSSVYSQDPATLLERFSEIALGAPKVTELSEPGSAVRTFVQRSRLIGFPDYITVKALPVEDGAALIVFSRSQYGYSDWGVNEKRVKDWLSKL